MHIPKGSYLIFSILSLFSYHILGQTNFTGFKTIKEPYQIRIGERFPDVIFSKSVNYENKSFSVERFKGKSVIIDIWAPWCGPCIAAFPKLDSLQTKYKSLLQILLVTGDQKEYVESTITNYKKKKGGISLFTAVEDSIISRQAKILPHYIWIDGRGVVKAITDGNEITNDKIEKFIRGEDPQLRPKEEFVLNVNENEPFFLKESKLWSKSDVLFQSTLTKCIQGFSTEAFRGVDWNWVRSTRAPIILLYKIAFGKFSLEFMNNNRVILEGFNSQNDSFLIGRYTVANEKEFQKHEGNHSYNYELIIPESNKNQLFETMQNDINRYFSGKGIAGRVEKRKIKALTLVRTSAEDKIETKGGKPSETASQFYLKIVNRPISAFLSKLQAFYYKEDGLPIKDKTGYRGNIDIEINGDIENIADVNKGLAPLGLRLEENEEIMDMVVITLKTIKQ